MWISKKKWDELSSLRDEMERIHARMGEIEDAGSMIVYPNIPYSPYNYMLYPTIALSCRAPLKSVLLGVIDHLGLEIDYAPGTKVKVNLIPKVQPKAPEVN